MKLYFFVPIVFSKLYVLCVNRKSRFVGENEFILVFASHGTEMAQKPYKNLTSVQNEQPKRTSTEVCQLPRTLRYLPR